MHHQKVRIRGRNSNFTQFPPCQGLVWGCREYILMFTSLGLGLKFSKISENLEKPNPIPPRKPNHWKGKRTVRGHIASWVEELTPPNARWFFALNHATASHHPSHKGEAKGQARLIQVFWCRRELGLQSYSQETPTLKRQFQGQRQCFHWLILPCGGGGCRFKSWWICDLSLVMKPQFPPLRNSSNGPPYFIELLEDSWDATREVFCQPLMRWINVSPSCFSKIPLDLILDLILRVSPPSTPPAITFSQFSPISSVPKFWLNAETHT